MGGGRYDRELIISKNLFVLYYFNLISIILFFSLVIIKYRRYGAQLCGQEICKKEVKRYDMEHHSGCARYGKHLRYGIYIEISI